MLRSVPFTEQPKTILCGGLFLPFQLLRNGGALLLRIPRTAEPGQQLRRIRERLDLKYRDVTQASQRIAAQQSNPEFAIGLSRLADIENKQTIPSIYRIYSLAAIYGLDFGFVLSLFGVNLGELPRDSMRLGFPQTREAQFKFSMVPTLPPPSNLEDELDLKRTTYISRHFHRWGKLPALLLQSIDIRKQRYAFIGAEDWFMYPMIRPGSFVQIDETKRHIRKDTPLHEFERPLYFLEHRLGFRCGWCSLHNEMLIVQSHAASGISPETYRYPSEIDVVGQVVAVAMRLDLGPRRRTRS